MIAKKLIERGTVPAWLAQVEARMLTRACLKAADEIGVELFATASPDPLAHFRSVTLALATATKDDPVLRHQAKVALGHRARKLGTLARRALNAKDKDAFALMRFLYQGIGIDIAGTLPGEIRFAACSFARAYDPSTCDLMSAMDQGVMRGLAGDGYLVFRQRITEGCPHCLACFSEGSTHD